MSNKIQPNKMLTLWGILSVSTAIICVLLRLFSLLFFYDSKIGYYDSGAVLPLIAQALPMIFLAVILVLCIIPTLPTTPNDGANCRYINFSAIFPAIGFTAYTISFLIAVYSMLLSGISLGLIDILSVISTIASCAFFWLIFAKKSGTGIYVATGIALIVRLLFMLAESYFDIQVQMNSPNKTVFQFAILSAMLLTVNELRVGQPITKPMFHLFSASAAVVFTTLSSIPSIISCFAGNMPQNYNLLFYDIILLLFAIYAVTRLCQLCFFNSCNKDADSECLIENDANSIDE